MRTIQITIRLTPAELAKIEAEADADGRDRSDWIRRALKLDPPKKKTRKGLDSRREAP